MPNFDFFIYPTSDFTTLDFGDASNLGTIETGASLNPIKITVNDDDNVLSVGLVDSTPGTIVFGSTDPPTPAIEGATIEIINTSGAEFEMDANGSERFFLVTLNGVDYVVHGDSSGAVLQPSTTYTEGTVGRSTAFNYSGLDVTCFMAGTDILTPNGPRRIEELRVGDLVQTMDHGAELIRWVGRTDFSAAEVLAHPNVQPIRIKSGALGDGVPSNDLYLSRQHRVLVRSDVAHRMFGNHEVLVSAHHLLQLDGVEVASEISGVTYFHLLFDEHQIVCSNGAPTESLYTGQGALSAVTTAARAEIALIKPGPSGGHVSPKPARYIPHPGRRARRLIARHIKDMAPVYRDGPHFARQTGSGSQRPDHQTGRAERTAV